MVRSPAPGRPSVTPAPTTPWPTSCTRSGATSRTSTSDPGRRSSGPTRCAPCPAPRTRQPAQPTCASWSRRWADGREAGGPSEVLAGVGRGVDGAAGLVALAADERADVDDPLALLARDPRPVVRVGGVGQVLVLLELVDAGLHEVADPQAGGAGLQVLLDGHLLGPVDDVLQHRAGVEVLEVQDLLVTVGVGDLEEAVLLALGVHPLDGALDHRGDRRVTVAAVLGQVVRVQRELGLEVLAEDVPRRLGVRPLDLDLHVQPARPEDRRVDHVLPVGGADDDDVLQPLHAVDLAEQLRHDRRLHVGGHARPAGPEDRVHLVEEHDDRRALAGLLPRPLEDQPDVPLGLADVLVEQLRALDVEEEGPRRVLPAHRGDLLGQRVGHRLGDQRLAAAGRAVEQDPLRRAQLVLAEQVGVQERQLDGVADLLDLPGQAADVAVVDVGDLLEDELLDLALGDPLVDVARARLEQQRVAHPQRLVGQRVGEVDHALLVGVPDDQRPLGDPVDRLQQLLEHDHVAGLLEAARLDDVHRLVEHDLLAVLEVLELDVGRDGDAQLAAAGEDVDGAVLVLGQVDAVAGRGLTEPVDLLLERDQLLACLAQGRGELVVALRQERRATLGLGQALLEHPHLAGAVGHLAAQEADLLLEVGDLTQQAGDVTFTPRTTFLRTQAHRAPPHTSGEPGRKSIHAYRQRAAGSRGVGTRAPKCYATFPGPVGPAAGPHRERASGGGSGVLLLLRAALAHGRHGALGQPPGGDQEGGVRDHPVLRADGEADGVPGPQERLPGVRLGPHRLPAQRLHVGGQLRRRRHVADQDPAGAQRGGNRREHRPRLEHVEDDAVDDLVRRVLGEVTQAQRPVARHLAEERADVGPGDVGEVLAPLVTGDRAALPHRAQQRAGQRAGAGAGLQHPHARADVAGADDLRGVLGVDDLGPAGHGEHEVGQQRPEGQIAGVRRREDDGSLRGTDELVVLDRAAVGVELLARLQDDGVQPSLGVGQLHPVADGERAGDGLLLHGLLRGGHERPAYGGGGCDLCPLLRRRARELSVVGPSLGPMTSMVQTGQPDGAAASPDAPRRPSLSPSRAADFKTCPLLYRFRTIDRLPERRSRAAVRGTLVHAVLERLYDLPAAQRTPAAAQELIAPAWAELQEADPEVTELFAPAADGSDEVAETLDTWLASAGRLVEAYFSLEDPTRIQPDGREQLVEVTLPDGLLLRGFVDRVDVAPSGAIRVVDYKTGATPREAFEAKALFQMKFYALVLWRTRGVVASQLKLLYLGDADALTYSPEEGELVRFERTLQAIWTAIERAVSTGDFRPSPSRLCGWCDHQALCPAFGGTPPPFPVEAAAAAGWATLPIVERD